MRILFTCVPIDLLAQHKADRPGLSGVGPAASWKTICILEFGAKTLYVLILY